MKKLRVSDINLNNDKVFTQVKAALSNFLSLQQLDLSDCSLNAKQLEELATILAENCTIENLNISYNSMAGGKTEHVEGFI